MKQTTMTHARSKLAQLWDEIERTRKPLTIARVGHEDMVLLPAAELERLQDAAIASLLARLGTDIDEHPERLQGFPAGLRPRMEALTEGVPINHDEEIKGDVSTPHEWHLSLAEQVALLRILAAPRVVTPELAQATAEAERLFGAISDDKLGDLTAGCDALFERMQDPDVRAATLRGFYAPLGHAPSSPAVSDDDRVARQQRIIALARHVWHNATDVEAFLTTPHAELGGRTPAECSATERDTAMVIGVLLRLASGVPG